jgi:hypothetical protein
MVRRQRFTIRSRWRIRPSAIKPKRIEATRRIGPACRIR